MSNSYEFLKSGLSRRGESFLRILSNLEAYETEGLLTKSEFSGLKSSLNTVLDESWSALIRAPFLHRDTWEKLNVAERNLGQALFLPYVHTVAGYLKKVVAAKKAEGLMRDAMFKFLTEVEPLCSRVMALKVNIGKRSPAPTKTSIAREERAAMSMTCQCCGRDILAETGVIAHHGYERPGMGWQTASCYGARHLPFEISRDALGEYIKMISDRIARTGDILCEVDAEMRPVSWTYSISSSNPYGPSLDTTVQVTRDTFIEVHAAYAEARAYRPHIEPTFDNLKAAMIRKLNGELRHLREHYARQQDRFNAWTQTHVRQDDRWRRL